MTAFQSSLIRGNPRSVRAAEFEQFAEKPVNYHRDVLADFSGPQHSQQPESRVREQDLRDALASEADKLRREYDEKLKTQLASAAAGAKSSAEGEFTRAIDLLKSYADMLQTEKDEIATRYEQEVLDLAFDIAGKILGARLEEHPESIALMTRQALKQVIECKRITVRANPDDLSYLQNLRADIAAQLSQDTRFEVISDSKVQPGGCVIDTERGSLDARVESQLETLRNNLQSHSE